MHGPTRERQRYARVKNAQIKTCSRWEEVTQVTPTMSLLEGSANSVGLRKCPYRA